MADGPGLGIIVVATADRPATIPSAISNLVTQKLVFRLGETQEPEISSESMSRVVAQVDEMLEIDPHDTRHMFWEEMKRILFAMREIQPEDLDDETMDEFMSAMDQLSNILYHIEKKRQKRERPAVALKI